MRNALILLLMLAAAAVPGSMIPQRSADPNGVRVFFDRDPQLAAIYDSLQLFDVYTSVWFSAIYILLFVSLVGCVLPRTKIHLTALRAPNVKTPANLSRMTVYRELPADEVGVGGNPADASGALDTAEAMLRANRYRLTRFEDSISAEKGYAKETGNLVFHFSLIAVLLAVGVGGGLSFSGQRVLVQGDTFVNNLASYDSFAPGPLFDENAMQPFRVRLDNFEVTYDFENPANLGAPLDFKASVTTELADGTTSEGEIRVNHPLEVPGANLYLTGNGFAPVITVRDGEGNVAYSGSVISLPQDGNYTSLMVVKVPDALPEQIGMIGFFYPTADKLASGAYTSIYPDPIDPLMTLNVYTGDLGLDSGVPRNVYALDTEDLTLVAGRNGPEPALELRPGQTAQLPDGLGSVTFDGVRRFVSLDIAYNPGGLWILLSALLAMFSVAVSLSVRRRRVWVRVSQAAHGAKIEFAGLARSEDPALEGVVDDLIADFKERRKEAN